MKVEMVQCAICEDMVTKRSTILLGKSRACRSHKEVIDHCVEIEQERLTHVRRVAEGRKNFDLTQRVDGFMRVMMGVAIVQSIHTFHGTPVGLIYSLLRVRGYTTEDIKKVHAEIDRQGGPLMNEEKILEVAATRSILVEKGLVPNV